MSAPARGFYLVPTNETLRLAEHAPDLGTPWPDMKPPKQKHKAAPRAASPLPLELFSDSDWRPLQHVLVHALARHPLRRAEPTNAAFCAVASPPQAGLYQTGHAARRAGGVAFGSAGGCGSVGKRWAAWRALCPPNVPLLVLDTVDADFRPFALCSALWERNRCLREPGTSVLRLVGSPPVTAHPGEPRPRQRSQLAPCPALSVPWLSHARAPLAIASSPERPVRIAGAFSTFQHGMAIALGFADWRRDLRDACHRLKNGTRCTHVYQSMSGKAARSAIELYSRSVFCLQPPGDVIPRGAIVDAIAVGCACRAVPSRTVAALRLATLCFPSPPHACVSHVCPLRCVQAFPSSSTPHSPRSGRCTGTARARRSHSTGRTRGGATRARRRRAAR